MTIKLGKIEKDGSYLGECEIEVNGEYVGDLHMDYAYINGRLRICTYSVMLFKEYYTNRSYVSKGFSINGRWEEKSRGAWGSSYFNLDNGYKTRKEAKEAALSYIAELVNG
jgi:hypothetical protein